MFRSLQLQAHFTVILTNAHVASSINIFNGVRNCNLSHNTGMLMVLVASV